MIVIKYKDVFNILENFKSCKKRCRGCKYKGDIDTKYTCDLNSDVCNNYAKNCKKKFNDAYKEYTWGNAMSNFMSDLKGRTFGSGTYGNYPDYDLFKEPLNQMKTDIENQKAMLLKRKQNGKAARGEDSDYNKEINKCKRALNSLKRFLKILTPCYETIKEAYESTDPNNDRSIYSKLLDI